MIKYEILPTLAITPNAASLRPKSTMPELVHFEDPALAVMHDFSVTAPCTIGPNEPIDGALNEMKVAGVHLLLVIEDNHIIGVISSEDILGEKPIRFIQHARVEREKVVVKHIMVPLEQIAAFNIEDVEPARVGNIVTTLKTLSKHYALVLRTEENSDRQWIRGIFTTSQISRQLHMDIASSLAKAESVSELQQKTKK